MLIVYPNWIRIWCPMEIQSSSEIWCYKSIQIGYPIDINICLWIGPPKQIGKSYLMDIQSSSDVWYHIAYINKISKVYPIHPRYVEVIICMWNGSPLDVQLTSFQWYRIWRYIGYLKDILFWSEVGYPYLTSYEAETEI